MTQEQSASTTLNSVAYVTADGTQETFPISFSIINREHVSFLIDNQTKDEANVTIEWETDASVKIVGSGNTPLRGGQIVQMKRETPIKEGVTRFVDGAVLRSRDLNASNEQVLFAVQEIADKDGQRLGKNGEDNFDAAGKKIVLLGDPDDPGDAVNKQFISTNIPNITTVANISTDVTACASIQAAISQCSTDRNHIAALGANNLNLTKVGNINGNVTKVADNDANVTKVADIDGNVTTVADNSNAVTIVAGLDDEISALGLITTDISGCYAHRTNISGVHNKLSAVENVANSITHVDRVSTDLALDNASTIKTVSGKITEVGTVAGLSTEITNLNSISSKITAVDTASSNIGTVAADLDLDNASTIKTVAGANTNITLCANNMADINTVASNTAEISVMAGHASNAAGSATEAANTLSKFNSDMATYQKQLDAASILLSSFGEDFIGNFNGPPSVADIDEDAFTNGMLYFDLTAKGMYIRADDLWVPNVGAPLVLIEEFFYTAADGDTAFTGEDILFNTLRYTPGSIQVTVNGIRLMATDFTATDGVTVTLTLAADASDSIHITAFQPFENVDMVSATIGGTFQGSVIFSSDIDCQDVKVKSLNIAQNGVDNTEKVLSVTSNGDLTYKDMPGATDLSGLVTATDFQTYKDDALTVSQTVLSTETAPSLGGPLDAQDHSIKFMGFTITGTENALTFSVDDEGNRKSLMTLDNQGNLTLRGNITAFDSSMATTVIDNDDDPDDSGLGGNGEQP